MKHFCTDFLTFPLRSALRATPARAAYKKNLLGLQSLCRLLSMLALALLSACHPSSEVAEKRLSADDVATLLQASVSSDELVQQVKANGYTGPGDVATLKRLKESGATAGLLTVIRQKASEATSQPATLPPQVTMPKLEKNTIETVDDEAGFRAIEELTQSSRIEHSRMQAKSTELPITEALAVQRSRPTPKTLDELATMINESQGWQPLEDLLHAPPESPSFNEVNQTVMGYVQPFVKAGFFVRDDYWGGTAQCGKAMRINHQFFKGNEYALVFGASTRSSNIELQVFDKSGKLLASHAHVGQLVTVPFTPPVSETYYLLFKVGGDPRRQFHYSVSYLYRSR